MDKDTSLEDRMAACERRVASLEWDLNIAIERLWHWKSRAERYRSAWLSARSGRRSWKNLYLGTIDPHRHDPLGLRFLDIARRHSRTIRELVSEMADLRLAFSEMEGAKAREADSGGS